MIPAQVYFAMPYVLAFVLALGIPVATALQYRMARAVSPDARITTLLLLIAFGALLTVALTPRTLNELELATAGRQLIEDLDDGFAASRYVNIILVGTGFVELLRGWINSRATKVVDPARPILYALIAFYIGTILIQAVGSAHPDFSYKSLYLPIVLLAVYYQRIKNMEFILAVAKLAILALMLCSLAGIAVKPDFVLHRPSPGVIPGVDFRLFGLTPHANALGPIALIGLMLELHMPSKPRLLRYLQLLSTTVVLVLAQSKTAWVAGIVAAWLVAVPLGLTSKAASGNGATHFGRAVFTLLLCIGMVIVVSVVLAESDIFGYLERTAQVDTLTGRTQIWELTLQGWRESLLFGYGRDIWGAERMLKFRLFHVGQAHNQFVQSLGEAGLMGLFLLLAYLLTLLYAALRQFTVSRGLALGLLILLLARCVTEAPLSASGLQSWPTFANVLLIVVACHYTRAHASALVGAAAVGQRGHRSGGRSSLHACAAINDAR